MNQDSPSTGKSAELRLRAEERLKGQSSETDGPRSEAQTERLLHELQVHQVELEMQNEELRDSRSQAEAALERYTDLYDFAPVGYFTLSPEATIREVNLPGASLLGIERIRLIGDCLRTVVSEDTRPIFDSWLKEVFASETRQSCVVALKRKSGPPMAVEIEATLSLDGKEARAVVVDITSRRALEEQLRQAQKLEIIGQLAGGVAHDFNNILGAMTLNLEMLQLQSQIPKDPESPWFNLDALTKRAASLTRQLLLFSRRQVMKPERLEINGVLANLQKTLESLMGEDILCRLFPGPEELWVEADPGMLEQVVVNVCLNAKDAMPTGGTLTLESSLAEIHGERARMHPDARVGQFACLRISDTGRGMDAEVLKRLFEPFFTTKEVGCGAGMGLASAHGIVHQHQGWMTVESVLAKGSTFRLYLPLAEKPTPVPRAITSILTPQGRGETILLVEDEEALLNVSTRALTLFGYRVLSATNGVEALEVWKQNPDTIDLVLTDMRMPHGMTGLDLVREIWKAKPSLKVIIMSGYSTEIASNKTDGERGYTFLAKPFGLKTLAETIRGCLD